MICENAFIIQTSKTLYWLFIGLDWIMVFNATFKFFFSYIVISFIGGVMVSVLASSAVDRGFETWLGKTKD